MSTPTGSTPVWRLVAERELRTKLKDKTFLAGVGFSLALLVVALVVSSFLSGSSDDYDVAVTDQAATRVVDQAQTALRASGGSEDTVDARSFDDASAAEAAVRDGDVDAALLPTDDGYEVVGDDEVDSGLRAALATSVAAEALASNAADAGVEVSALQQGSELEQRLLDPDAAQSDGESAIAFGFVIIFFVTALGFGMSIAQSVVQEKESRVVEILAAAVPIRAMLWGKIAGNTVLALGQVVLLVAVAMVGLNLTGQGGLVASVGPAVGWYVALFVLGFVALASLWSVAGAMAGSQQDLQSTTLPAQMILLVPYMVSIFASDKVAEVMSMLPIVSTMTMPGRIAQGDVPLWQIGVAIGVTVLAAVVFVRVGTRLYERTLLQTGRKIGYREAFHMTDTAG
ncbi:ABC transporter permease [Solicola sp. PLA-1-18]|uniref:ABC transporter permease n=1 Tax=Solicola sp. PLA-1-18 TaxID=3380532 RepID=UPI003B7772ED